MLKERGVAPFSKWDKELPKIVFDPRFKHSLGSGILSCIVIHACALTNCIWLSQVTVLEERCLSTMCGLALKRSGKKNELLRGLLWRVSSSYWKKQRRILIATLIIKHLRANGERIHDLRSCPGKKESFC
ncbi:uncharacterized protein LOC111365247 isoform X2 [Olea europaea var. sylvestris]|uniref:uncharacterized protein LOC111365247 isoform X2 n=1 Tax=Olea europaea var. sylvestris TaxID=158386 RepID=UPI000C1D5062|nr:uncharacterized protein LOC111365247 isoform X2 [Olea europaea var. sylvestris]